MKREMTATIYIVEEERVLLIFHKKHNKWLPPGGHIDPNEIPSEAAIREAKEETGLDVAIIPQENIWIAPQWNGRSIERPYLCLLEHIPARGDEPPHDHIDMIYVGKPVGGSLEQNPDETEGLRWFTLDEVQALEPDVEIFPDTIAIIEHLIMRTPVPSDRAYATA